MKQLVYLIAVWACCLGAMRALAGPESLPSGKEMKQVAQVVPECAYNWTGFYVGGFGGYVFGSADQHLNLGGTWARSPIAERDLIESEAGHDLDANGGQAGGIVGYNYEWNKWVFGLEADGGYLWLRNSSHRDFEFGSAPFPNVFRLNSSFKSHYLVTMGPRIGYSFCRLMPYVTGGVAFGDVDHSQRLHENFFLGSLEEHGSSSDTNVGWMIGGGLEYQLTHHWRLRAQYRYADLGSSSFDSTGSGFVLIFPLIGYTAHHSIDLHEHTADFGIVFAF